MSSFGIPRAFRRSKQSQTKGAVPQLVIDVKRAKVQHLVGVPTKYLQRARSQSVSPSSTTKPPTSSLSDATTASVSSTVPSRNKWSPYPRSTLHSKASSVLLRDEVDTVSTKNPQSGAQLSTFQSSSTLHSHYDAAKAPLSISQQTSDSSSRDFALRKGTPSVLPPPSQEMEHARQMLFLKSSKPRSKESKKLVKINARKLQVSASSPIGGLDMSRTPTAADDHVASRSSTSLPADPPPMTPGRKLFSGLRRSESQQARASPASRNITHNPYAKVNVRRPKVGAKHWFDDVGDDLSEEEHNQEPAASSHFVSQVEEAFAAAASTTSSAQNSISTVSTISTVPVASEPARKQRSAVSPRTQIPQGSARALLADHKAPIRAVSFKEQSHLEEKSPASRKLRKRPSVLATADLSIQSILSLSSSDDEDEVSNEAATEAPACLTKIRESLSEEQTNESDAEIGIAKAVKASPGEPLVRATHPRTEAIRSLHGVATPISVPARASSRHTSYIIDLSSENDTSEPDIIASFPATPSDTASFRTSIRSSMISDTGSLASTRPMLVTRQEEKLLAAMRLKKAALRQTERETDRSSALRVLESGGRHSAMSDHQNPGRDQVAKQARLDHRLSNRYIPAHSHQRFPSGEDMDFSSAHTRESGTTFETSIYSQRNSQATMRTMFSDDSDSPYSAYPRSDATVMSPTRSQHPPRGRQGNGRRSHYSSPSNGSSTRRDSHVVMLDGLDEALSRDHIPSQLFMEAPFIGWERAGLTTTAH